MYQTLNTGAIGVKSKNLGHLIELAARYGFGGAEIYAPEVADLVDKEGVDAVRKMFTGPGIRPGAWFVPDTWRADAGDWKRDLEGLPRLAKAAAAIGATRVVTYIWPCSDELEMKENRKFHVDRLAPAAKVLADHGCSLGLEFIGTKTLRDEKKHPFIHTLEGMLELGKEVGPGTGLLLDCWHWYTSQGTVKSILGLKPEQVVYVHVNDAPPGIPVDQQQDMVRRLPGETGIIDIKSFLSALAEIGYDGPVTAEPFSKELAAMPDDDARLKAVKAGMDRIFNSAGLPIPG